MSRAIEKPKVYELQGDLNAIFEIPERVKKIDSVRISELIIYAKNELIDRFGFIIGLVEVNSNTDFEYWAIRSSQYGMTYYDLENIKELLSQHLEQLKKEPQQKFTHKIFYDNGFEVFEYLNQSIKIKSPTIKYTAIYNILLRFDKIREGQNLYKTFIKDKYSTGLNTGDKVLKFSRFCDNSGDTYNTTYNKLVVLYENKYKTPKE